MSVSPFDVVFIDMHLRLDDKREIQVINADALCE